MMKEKHKPVFKETGNKIMLVRLKKGLSLKDLAKKSNLTAARISKIENGETNFRLTTLFKIAAALEVKVNTLVGDKQITLKKLLDFD